MSGQQRKLLISVPTYERPNDITRLLNAVEFVRQYKDIDVVIVDSSLEEKTANIVKKYSEGGFRNLYYRHCNSKIPSNKKVFMIYKKYCQYYEYIWVLHDHTLFSKEAFDYICRMMDEKDDLIFLRMQGNTFSRRTYDNVEWFAQNNAWLIGKMGTSIVRSEVMLTTADWNYYRKRYLKRNTINFSHVGFYLERISEINKPKLAELEFPRDQFVDTHKYERLSWEKEVLRICTQCWCNVIFQLPRAYKNKLQILNSIDHYFLTKYKLIEGRRYGYYNLLEYLRYRKWIRIVFPELYVDAFKISVYPYNVLEEKYIAPLREVISIEKNKGREIYIYGAGRHGVECLNFMRMAGIGLDGFLVSSLSDNPKTIRGHIVYELDERIKKGFSVFAIISVMNELQNEIEANLREKLDNGADISWCTF